MFHSLNIDVLSYHDFLFVLDKFFIYRTRAIITRSRFETALDYKLRILGPTFLFYVLN